MSQYPLNELKRRLQDDSTSLPKRLKLAKNVVQSYHLPTAPKERVVSEWLDELVQANKLASKELRDILGWLNNVDDLTAELKLKLIKIISQYLHSNPLQNEDVSYIITFLENDKILPQLKLQIDDYLFITTTLLQNLNGETDEQDIQKIFNNIIKYYKDSKKKLEFIVKLLHGENLETIFNFLDTKSHDPVINMCKVILFPESKKQFFLSFLLNLIRKDNIDELIAERGDNIQSVIKIMSAFFTFPKDRTEKNSKFLSDFINMFVTCYGNESQIIFAFYIMVVSSLNMPQNYLSPAMVMPPIIFEDNSEKIKRNLFLNMLQVIHSSEVDISVRLTDTLGDKVSKVEIKKTFISFLQIVMMGQLKLEGKLDKTTLQIIKIALKLDPSLIEQKIDKILPHIMTAKKNNPDIIESYTQTMNCLLETLFKLSRGMDFLNQIIPHLKINLEASNVEQFELKQKLQEALNNGEDNSNKIMGKIITGDDMFPQECVDVYGKLTSELMFRQNRELLISLQKDFEENCLMMLEEGFVSPSIITLAEMISAILSSFLRYNKMADHTVPLHIADDFWMAFQTFEEQCLNKFGECILKLNYNSTLVVTFLNLCLSVCHLKLLNIKYSNTKLNIEGNDLLPFISKNEWIVFTSKLQDDTEKLLWSQLLLTKSMAVELLSHTTDENTSDIKTNLIKQIPNHPEILSNSYITKNIFTNLDKNQLKQASKTLIKLYQNDPHTEIFKNEVISMNKDLLQHLVLKVTKNITECIENMNTLSKALNKSSFEITSFLNDNDSKMFFNPQVINQDDVTISLDILKHLQIYYLEENYQLTAIFVLLILKNCCQNKKIKKSIDYILQSIYELSPKYPDIFKIFPVDFIFDFKDAKILELLKLKIKTSNDMLIIKCVLESAVKKVKTDSEIVVNIVEILLKNLKKNKANVDYFGDNVFQISCLILPLIAKEKKAITTSAFRSILANLQEKLNKSMLESFKNIDFNKSNIDESGNTDVEENTIAILNAMGAYSLTLLKCCETTNAEELKNLNCLWSGLTFFVKNAIKAIASPTSKYQQVDSSIQLLNVTLRYIKKLEAHEIFQKKDELFLQTWNSIKARLLLIYDQNNKTNNNCLEEMSVTLKFIAELSSVECFSSHFVGDLSNLTLLKKPSIILKNTDITNSQLTARKVSKYLWINCLKANIIGPKCIAVTKLIFRATKNIRFWIQQNYDLIQNVTQQNGVSQNGDDDINEEITNISNVVKIEDCICELLKNDLDILSEVILAAKKITLDFKFLDAIFELQHLFHYILGRKTIDTMCEVSWQGFNILFEGCVAILNYLLLSREELLEDRWPCYMQSYKALVLCLCERATKEDLTDKSVEHKLAEMAHSIEKLTQSICKRKTHVSRISAYAVADICTWLESSPPPKMVRQHLENSIALLIQVSDSTYAMAFLRRALAGSVGQMTLTNMYTMYKRYHKYVGNA
ncbi:uncharacterized protein LOC125073926 [Vanessa atalanta]|uniref:uncharacterized protein LOC125073926 n=1 Tax=Vanessa atalanta TaxID=42275 RepID=UPI001FCD3E10|nr:uncharacterized protein LOC125073926 [Vanessa atalanta]